MGWLDSLARLKKFYCSGLFFIRNITALLRLNLSAQLKTIHPNLLDYPDLGLSHFQQAHSPNRPTPVRSPFPEH
jgi:hypothetical protein